MSISQNAANKPHKYYPKQAGRTKIHSLIKIQGYVMYGSILVSKTNTKYY